MPISHFSSLHSWRGPLLGGTTPRQGMHARKRTTVVLLGPHVRFALWSRPCQGCAPAQGLGCAPDATSGRAAAGTLPALPPGGRARAKSLGPRPRAAVVGLPRLRPHRCRAHAPGLGRAAGERPRRAEPWPGCTTCPHRDREPHEAAESSTQGSHALSRRGASRTRWAAEAASAWSGCRAAGAPRTRAGQPSRRGAACPRHAEAASAWPGSRASSGTGTGTVRPGLAAAQAPVPWPGSRASRRRGRRSPPASPGLRTAQAGPRAGRPPGLGRRICHGGGCKEDKGAVRVSKTLAVLMGRAGRSVGRFWPRLGRLCSSALCLAGLNDSVFVHNYCLDQY
jgi:hypothetical protein